MRRLTLTLCIAVLLVPAAPTNAIVQPQPVVGGAGEQYDPFVSDDLIVYTTYASKRSHAYLRNLSDGSTTRLEATGQGEAGGIDAASQRVIYTQWDADTRGNLFLYNLDTGQRSQPPGINTGFWEWDGRISSTFILFLRDRKTSGTWYADVLLYRRTSETTRRIATYPWSRITTIEMGTVGDRYAAWTVCSKEGGCSARVYDDVPKTIRTIPTKNGRRQYAPAVDETNGTVYFSRLGGARWCRDVNVWRLPLDGFGATPTKIVALPDGADTGWTSSVAANATTGEVDLYFERWVCAKSTGDIFVARGVDTLPGS